MVQDNRKALGDEVLGQDDGPRQGGGDRLTDRCVNVPTCVKGRV